MASGLYPAHFWAYARTRTPAHVYPAQDKLVCTHAHTFLRPSTPQQTFCCFLYISVFSSVCSKIFTYKTFRITRITNSVSVALYDVRTTKPLRKTGKPTFIALQTEARPRPRDRRNQFYPTVKLKKKNPPLPCTNRKYPTQTLILTQTRKLRLSPILTVFRASADR